MSDDFAKFIFLGVMILVVMVGSRGVVQKEAERFSGAQISAVVGGAQTPSDIDAPLFVLEPPDRKAGERIDHAAEQARRGAVKKEEAANKVEPIFVDPPIISGASPQSNAGSAGSEPQSAFFWAGSGEPPPEVRANAAIVADMLSGEIFFELRPERMWPIASITKLVTAAVVSRDFPMHQEITISQEDFPFGIRDNGIREGEKYSVRDLFSAIIVASSNQAAEALARAYPSNFTISRHGGRGAFIEEMNKIAREWGIENANFDDPTGLSVSNQSTAKDLLGIARIINSDYPEIFATSRQTSVAITEINSGNRVIMKSTNLFAGLDNFLGGKTGYTDEAGGNLLSVFSYKNRPIAIIVLGTEDRFGETEKLLSWLKRNN